MLLDATTYSSQLAKLAELFELSFKRSIDPRYLQWRYLDNPVGEVLACVRNDGDRLIANYSASPVRMSVHGQVVKAAMSMTTMTHPDYAGQGLFTKLATELYEHMATHGYAMVWGFPNNQSHRGFVSRLGWVDVYEIPTMRGNLARIKADPVTVHRDDSFEREYRGPSPVADGIFVHKDREYLRWRYRDNPINRYAILLVEAEGPVSSYCVVKPFQDSLDIVDFQASDPDAGLLLLKGAVQHARDHELSTLNCWAPRHHFIHSLCERLGFENHEPITYLGLRSLAGLEGGRAISSNYSDWYLQMGDSDVF